MRISDLLAANQPEQTGAVEKSPPAPPERVETSSAPLESWLKETSVAEMPAEQIQAEAPPVAEVKELSLGAPVDDFLPH